MKNRIIIYLLLSLMFLGCKMEEKKPNILFIMSDDHTSQAWGIYGGILQDYVQNEHIKNLANEGVVLNNAFCTNAICVPSRASILTGQYSHKNGVYDLEDGLSSDSMNVAKLLQTGGYQTAIVGKWHLKNKPAGFDHYLVLPGQGVYHDPILRSNENWETGGKKYEGFSADVIANQSLEWLKSRKSEKPFVLFTHFKATHEPFDYPERFKNLFDDLELPYPENLDDLGAETTGRTHDGWPIDILTQRYLNNPNGRYPGEKFTLNSRNPLEIRKQTYQKFVKDFLRSGAAIDDNIGKLIEHLKESGEYENTIIIYTADQGYFLGEHSFFDKRFIYEQSLRMPFVIRYPKEFEKGKRIDEIILNIDFPSLLLDFAGVQQPNSMQGKSFRHLLAGKKDENWRKDMYYRYWSNEPRRPAHFGIRTDRYKLAFFYGQSRTDSLRSQMDYEPGWEFYDLEKDPNENYNAINNSEYARVIRDLKNRLKVLKDQQNDTTSETEITKEIILNYW